MAKEPRPLSHLERLIGEAIGDRRAIGLPDDPAKDTMPVLWEWLTAITAGRDYVKQPAKVTITMGPDGCLISLTDPDLTLGLECSCPFLADALTTLNAVLSGPNPPFKLWGKRQPTLRKRKSQS